MEDPYANELSAKMTFMVLSSAVCICLGLCYAFGAARVCRGYASPDA
jgi:hypothetical protein